MNDINQRLQAAQILGLEIEEEYKEIEGKFFVIITIKGKEQSFPIPMKKDEVVIKLEKEKNDLQKRLKRIELNIKMIKGMKC